MNSKYYDLNPSCLLLRCKESHPTLIAYDLVKFFSFLTLAVIRRITLLHFLFLKEVGNVGHCNCRHHHPYYRYNDELSDYDDYDYTDDDSDEEFWESIASRLRNKYEARKYMPKGMCHQMSNFSSSHLNGF